VTLRKRVLGFSLLELMVVVVLLAGLMAIVIPAISSLASADVKKEVNRLAALCWQVYSNAAMSGIPHRINIDLDNQSYWAEIAEGEAGSIGPVGGYEDLMKALVAKGKKEAEKSVEHDYVPQFKEIPDPLLGEKHSLDKNIVFYGAWTAPMQEVARTGIISLYFNANAETPASFVSLAQKGDEADTAMYIAPNPLTGAINTGLGEPEINLDEGKSEEI